MQNRPVCGNDTAKPFAMPADAVVQHYVSLQPKVADGMEFIQAIKTFAVISHRHDEAIFEETMVNLATMALEELRGVEQALDAVNSPEILTVPTVRPSEQDEEFKRRNNLCAAHLEIGAADELLGVFRVALLHLHSLNTGKDTDFQCLGHIAQLDVIAAKIENGLDYLEKVQP